MGENKKRQFLECAYAILKEEGVEGISIRNLAKKVGCTSTVIYRYFDNLEHLVVMASVGFLKEYIIDFKKCLEEIRNPLELNIKLWEIFFVHALEHADIYEMLFFGDYKDSLVDIIYEYYEMFSKEFENMDGLTVSIIFNGSLRDRDYIVYRRAATMGYIDSDAVPILAQLDEYMIHGALLDCKTQKWEKAKIQEKAVEFSNILRAVLDKFKLK